MSAPQRFTQAETAFLVASPGGHHLRWFTPAVEVDLCGHATLASAHLLWEEGHLQPRATSPRGSLLQLPGYRRIR